jgi:3-hydroxyisobutyrate dehydrogenase-like beta-hydroxyacid dehydrogenase
MQTKHFKLAVIGFGEAGRAFASGWVRPEGMELVTYDPKTADPAMRASFEAAAGAAGVTLAASNPDAVSRAGAVFSLVTADRAHEAARESAVHIAPGAFFFDCNSCSPATKAASAEVIAQAGGRYVDVAVMAPVHPKRHETPILLSGPEAEAAIPFLTGLGMFPRVAGGRVGEASSIKMLRSVMIKGLEALTAEAMLAARKAGVEAAVIASLQASDPGIDWEKRSAYNLERMMVHGERRAAEMREVAATLRELGLPDRMASAIVDWQADIAALKLEGGEASLANRADRILDALANPRQDRDAP